MMTRRGCRLYNTRSMTKNDCNTGGCWLSAVHGRLLFATAVDTHIAGFRLVTEHSTSRQHISHGDTNTAAQVQPGQSTRHAYTDPPIRQLSLHEFNPLLVTFHSSYSPLDTSRVHWRYTIQQHSSSCQFLFHIYLANAYETVPRTIRVVSLSHFRLTSLQFNIWLPHCSFFPR